GGVGGVAGCTAKGTRALQRRAANRTAEQFEEGGRHGRYRSLIRPSKIAGGEGEAAGRPATSSSHAGSSPATIDGHSSGWANEGFRPRPGAHGARGARSPRRAWVPPPRPPPPP